MMIAAQVLAGTPQLAGRAPNSDAGPQPLGRWRQFTPGRHPGILACDIHNQGQGAGFQPLEPGVGGCTLAGADPGGKDQRQ